MQDLQNYQYYDPSPQPPPMPWWKRKRTWQLSGLLGVTAVVLVFVTVAGLNAMKNHQLDRQAGDLMGQASALELQLASECDDGDEQCIVLARADAARALGLVGACDELRDEAYTNCVTLIAIDKADPQVCNVLSGDERAACADTPYLLKATAEMNLRLCDQIAGAGTRASCSAQVKSAAIASGQCEEAGLEASLCDQAEAVAAAIESGNPSACEALDEDGEYECVRAQLQADRDNDGLVAEEEAEQGTSDGLPDTDADGLTDGDEVHVHATDPAEPDTDGDGYPDGTEVASGYDPLK